MRDVTSIARRSLSSDTVVLWIHDCENELTLDPVAFAAFLRSIVDAGCRYFWVVLNKQGVQSASKEALNNLRQRYEAVLWKFRDEASGRVRARKSRVSLSTSEDLFDILDEMHIAVWEGDGQFGIPELLLRSGLDKTSSNSATIYEEGPRETVETAIAKDTTDPDTFWSQFLVGTLTIGTTTLT
ncbi:hypothetical protein BDW69DRAFT_190169 [Aspergillus filifer]